MSDIFSYHTALHLQHSLLLNFVLVIIVLHLQIQPAKNGALLTNK